VSQPRLKERLGIVGSGTIAVRLCQLAAPRGEVHIWARSEASADRAREKTGEHDRVVTMLDELGHTTFVVEAVTEDHDLKVGLLRELNDILEPGAILASTTSSLSIERLAEECGRPERFVGLHVFNPVDKMELVELAFPPAATDDTRERARALCEDLDKTVVEVPDIPGFVVNRLLFPYLFSAVALLEEDGLEPDAVDTCMKLGAGHPMGPLALLDFVGLDVAQAIGQSIGQPVPAKLRELVDAGRLGKKAGAGFYDYS
jgi:3-hydroxybutyryl-CoA dehydrogenase